MWQRVLTHEKCNIAATGIAMPFRLEWAAIDGLKSHAQYLVWGDPDEALSSVDIHDKNKSWTKYRKKDANNIYEALDQLFVGGASATNNQLKDVIAVRGGKKLGSTKSVRDWEPWQDYETSRGLVFEKVGRSGYWRRGDEQA